MSLLYWFDNRTLLACQLLLAFVFTAVFACISRIYPYIPGARFIALSFLLGVPGSTLLVLRGHVPDVVSIMVANTFILASFTSLYHGVLLFVGSKRTVTPVFLASLATLGVLFYYSEVQHNIAPRVVALSLTIALARGLIARELILNATQRYMRAFAVSMCIFTLSGINRGLITLIHGSPTNYMQRDSVQTSTLIGGVVSICLTGLFFLLLYHDTTVRRVTAESEFDVLSGTLNRRGIERRLIVELNHINRTKQKLSIGLIDVDHFKSVNDTVGHPAGDTVLRAVVSAITGQIRDYDFLGRFGGDEFLLLLPQTSVTDALVVANRVGEAVRSCPSPIDGTPLTISIGISEAVPGEAAEILIARADHALYNAKNAGRNCSRSIVFDSTQQGLSDSESVPDLLPS